MSRDQFFGDGEKPDWGTDQSRIVLLDKNHAYKLTGRVGRDGLTGAMVWHRREDGSWCGGGIQWWKPEGEGGATWTLVSLTPLHVEPSIKCGTCEREFGDNGVSHGYIRGDEWVPAGAVPEWAR